uniref:Uncharacterized protein n=1 Tax=Solanum lycopersicum TaxID=4081 RepID=A0A3Q7FUD0_SOLLC
GPVLKNHEIESIKRMPQAIWSLTQFPTGSSEVVLSCRATSRVPTKDKGRQVFVPWNLMIVQNMLAHQLRGEIRFKRRFQFMVHLLCLVRLSDHLNRVLHWSALKMPNYSLLFRKRFRTWYQEKELQAQSCKAKLNFLPRRQRNRLDSALSGERFDLHRILCGEVLLKSMIPSPNSPCQIKSSSRSIDGSLAHCRVSVNWISRSFVRPLSSIQRMISWIRNSLLQIDPNSYSLQIKLHLCDQGEVAALEKETIYAMSPELSETSPTQIKAADLNVEATQDVSQEDVQQALLKMFEGTIVSVPDNRAWKLPRGDTTQIAKAIIFTCAGVESDDFIVYGLIPEFVARLPDLVSCIPYIRISLYRIWTKFLAKVNGKICALDKDYEK